MAYSCGCAIRDHSVAFLRNGVLVFGYNHDGMVVDVVYSRSVVCHDNRVRVSCAHRNDVRVVYDTQVLYDIRVCVYDILVFCYSLHDEMVAYNDHNDDGLVYLHDVAVVEVDNEAYALHSVVYTLRDDKVYALREPMDNEVPMVVYRIYLALELVLLTQSPKMIQKLSAILYLERNL